MSSETSTPVNTTSERFTGRVKWFNNKAGYGFITLQTDTNDVNDIFVHHSGIQTDKEQFKYLVEGEYVEFQTSVDGDKTVAVEVRGPGSGKLMCETREENRRTRMERRRTRPSQTQEQQPPRVQQHRQRYTPVRQIPLFTGAVDVPDTGYVVVPTRSLRQDVRGRGRGGVRGRGTGRGRGSVRGRGQ